MESKILKFIKDNSESWEQELNKRLIRTSHKGDLVCFKYATEADFSDPLVCEARGIIIDVARPAVVCWPFDKFFNVQEQYAAEIDWGTARVLEKIDGSLIKLYWYNGEWVFATSFYCDASDAPVPGHKDMTYRDIIAMADNYDKIPFQALDRECTYLFELVSPLTQVVIKYDRTLLYYLSMRNNRTGEERDSGLGSFQEPSSYPLNTLDACLKAVMKLNEEAEQDVKKEGFVVVDGDHRRIKIKSPAYVVQHRMVMQRVFTAKRIAELYMQRADFGKLAREFPRDARIIKYYDWQLEEVRHGVEEMAQYARALYEEYGHDRRAVASMIQSSPYAWAGFAAIGNDKNADELLRSLSVGKIQRCIMEYKM